jgi:hypothetical protein
MMQWLRRSDEGMVIERLDECRGVVEDDLGDDVIRSGVMDDRAKRQFLEQHIEALLAGARPPLRIVDILKRRAATPEAIQRRNELHAAARGSK